MERRYSRPRSDVRERRPTLPLCRLVPFCPEEGLPCNGPVEWRLTVLEKGLTFHSCDAHLGPAIRGFSAQGAVEISHIEARSLEGTGQNTEALIETPPPEPARKITNLELPNPPADERQTARPGLYSHVHLPQPEERVSQRRGAEIDARPHYPDAATPSPGAPAQGPAGTPDGQG